MSRRVSPKQVLASKAATPPYGDRLLFEGMRFRLPRGGITGVIGPTARARGHCSG